MIRKMAPFSSASEIERSLYPKPSKNDMHTCATDWWSIIGLVMASIFPPYCAQTYSETILDCQRVRCYLTMGLFDEPIYHNRSFDDIEARRSAIPFLLVLFVILVNGVVIYYSKDQPSRQVRSGEIEHVSGLCLQAVIIEKAEPLLGKRSRWAPRMPQFDTRLQWGFAAVWFVVILVSLFVWIARTDQCGSFLCVLSCGMVYTPLTYTRYDLYIQLFQVQVIYVFILVGITLLIYTTGKIHAFVDWVRGPGIITIVEVPVYSRARALHEPLISRKRSLFFESADGEERWVAPSKLDIIDGIA